MYCVKCGVELADTEASCPLCKTRVYHPDIPRQEGEGLYPKHKYPKVQTGSKWPHILLAIVYLLPMLLVLLCDLQFNGKVVWSGIVIGALLIVYEVFLLPAWFQDPNPVIFVPCSFAAVGLYLLYIDQLTGGGWFLSFAFPVVGSIGLIVTTVVTLVKYVRRGKLYIFGGAAVALGMFILLMEFLMGITFPDYSFIGWSWYPMVSLAFLGGLLIFLGICRPAREAMERKFFI